VHPGFDRLPGPLRHQAPRDQPPHAVASILHRDLHHNDLPDTAHAS